MLLIWFIEFINEKKQFASVIVKLVKWLAFFVDSDFEVCLHLKERLAHKWRLSHYLLTLMQMESTSQNMVSQQNNDAAFS